jgi:hypothetical protein
MATPCAQLAVVREQVDGMCADACILFSTGRVHEAMLVWHGAVRTLLPLVTEEVEKVEEEEGEWPPSDERGAPSEKAPASPEARRLRGALVAHPPLGVVASHDRTFALYGSALQYVVPPPTTVPNDGPRRTLEDDVAAAAAAVYNLGLCHHLHGLAVGGGGSERCHAKALRAYGASRRLLEGSGLCCGGSPSGGAADEQHQQQQPPPPHHEGRAMLLLQLALANNAGHVHDQMHRHDDARQQLEDLHRLLASPPPQPPRMGEAEALVPFLLTAALYPARELGRVCPHAPSA